MLKKDQSTLDLIWKVLLSLILLVYAGYYAKTVIMPIVFSAFLAIILNPVVRFLEGKKLSTGLSILITIITALLLLFFLGYLSSSQAKLLTSDLPDLVERYHIFLDKSETQLHDTFGISARDQIELIRENSSGIISSSTGILTDAYNATSSVISFITLVPIYVVFMLLSRNNFKRFLLALGKKNGKNYLELGTEIKEMVYSYIGGLLIVIIIIATLNTIGLLALGIKHAIFLGVLSGALTIIPYVGIMVGGSIPVLVALLTKDSLFYPLAVIVLIGLVQFLEGNFITPKIMGSKVNINPLAAIIALIIGASIWGIMGMILAIPMIGIVKIIFSHIDSLKPFAILLGTESKD